LGIFLFIQVNIGGYILVKKATSEKDNLFYGLGKRMTDEQQVYYDAIMNPNKKTIFCNSKAGTGKTQLAVACAHYLVKKGDFDGAVYVFAPVEEDKMGYRPGTQREKEEAYITPLKDALIKINLDPAKEIAWTEEDKKYNKWIEISSHTFQRGINLEKKIIIIDEAQNFTKPQLKKTMTRIHDNGKCIIIGHTGQIDLDNISLSGFSSCIEHFKDEPFNSYVELKYNFRGKISQHADKW
jgi:phosphate starvation-inducible protein PhoH and related proteins